MINTIVVSNHFIPYLNLYEHTLYLKLNCFKTQAVFAVHNPMAKF